MERNAAVAQIVWRVLGGFRVSCARAHGPGRSRRKKVGLKRRLPASDLRDVEARGYRDWEALKSKHVHVFGRGSDCRDIKWLELNSSQGL